MQLWCDRDYEVLRVLIYGVRIVPIAGSGVEPPYYEYVPQPHSPTIIVSTTDNPRRTKAAHTPSLPPCLLLLLHSLPTIPRTPQAASKTLQPNQPKSTLPIFAPHSLLLPPCPLKYLADAQPIKHAVLSLLANHDIQPLAVARLSMAEPIHRPAAHGGMHRGNGHKHKRHKGPPFDKGAMAVEKDE